MAPVTRGRELLGVEIRRMRDLTDKPFGVNIAQNLVRDPAIADFVVDNGVGLGAGLPFAGQVSGRIEAIRPVAEVVEECARECLEVLHDLARR